MAFLVSCNRSRSRGGNVNGKALYIDAREQAGTCTHLAKNGVIVLIVGLQLQPAYMPPRTLDP